MTVQDPRKVLAMVVACIVAVVAVIFTVAATIELHEQREFRQACWEMANGIVVVGEQSDGMVVHYCENQEDAMVIKSRVAHIG